MQIVRLLVNLGLAIRIVLLRESPILRAELPGVPIDCVHLYRIRNPFGWRRILSVAVDARQAGCCRAWTFLNDSSLLAPLLLPSLGYRVYVSRRDIGYWMTGARKIAARILRRRISRWVVNSRSVAEATIRLEYADPASICIIPNILANQVWLDGIVAHDFSALPVRAAVIANVSTHKRLDVVVAAVQLLKKRGIHIEVDIAGGLDKEPATFEALLSQIDRSGLNGLVRFLGPQWDIRSFLADKCMVISASISEGLSNAVIETMCHGRLAICSRVPGNTDLVVDEKTGFLFECGNPSDLADVIEASISNSRRSVEVAKYAKAVAMERFSVDRVREAMLEALELA